jgi:teichuronic acid biosynthesis glycosyltransferase TuaC
MIGGYGPSHLGGEIHRELALEIRGRGHDYQIFTPGAPGAEQGQPADAIEDGVPVHRAPAGRWSALADAGARALLRYPRLVSVTRGLEAFLASRPPFDVIIAEGGYPLGVACWWAVRAARVPYVVSVLGGDFLANKEAGYGFGRYALPRRLMRLAFRHAAVVRSISPLAADRAIALGCPIAKSVVVQRQIARGAFPPGPGLEAFRREAGSRVRDRFGLGRSPLIVAVGRLLPIKGFDVLLRALPAVAAACPSVRLLIAGPNRRDERGVDHRQRLETIAHDLGINKRLSLPGTLTSSEVRDVLAAGDVLAVPSLEEGGNKVLPEAAAVGTPAVATRTSGNTPWAEAWGCALSVAPGSPRGLADGLVRVISDGNLSQAMAQRGPLFAEAFRTERVATRLLAVCEAARDGSLPPSLRECADLVPSGSREGVSS